VKTSEAGEAAKKLTAEAKHQRVRDLRFYVDGIGICAKLFLVYKDCRAKLPMPST